MAPDFPAIVKRILSMTENIQITRPLSLISNKYVLVVHFFDFIFCSFEEINKGKRHMRAFCPVHSSPFNGTFRAGEGDVEGGKESLY